MNDDYYVNGLRLPADLASMINDECKRKEALNGFCPGTHRVIIDALYEYFLWLAPIYEEE